MKVYYQLVNTGHCESYSQQRLYQHLKYMV